MLNKQSTWFIVTGLVTLSVVGCKCRKEKAESPPALRLAIVGDMPYKDNEDKCLTGPNGKIYKAIKDYKPDVLIHVGDFKKSKGEPCTNELLRKRKDQISLLNPGKTVYTPGDNDWTDCDRDNQATSELERLEFLREIFLKKETEINREGTIVRIKPNEMIKDIPGLVRQTRSDNSDDWNAMWSMKGILFSTLHIVGGNNGREEILTSGIKEQALDEADKRDRLNIEWVNKTFSQAKEKNPAAVVIAFHADIYDPKLLASKKPPCNSNKRESCDGYEGIRRHIKQKALEWGGQVLIIHGDTNAYCYDKLENMERVYRLNAGGDYKLIDAVRVDFYKNGKDIHKIDVKSMSGRYPGGKDKSYPKKCDYEIKNYKCSDSYPSGKDEL